jgi:hypothetical protein
MTHRATQDVVQRVRPLLEKLAPTTLERARLLQYLSARAGVAWGALEVVAEEAQADGTLRLAVRDRVSGDEHVLTRPACLRSEVDPLAAAEYQRLALNRPLTLMAEALFAHLYGKSHCARCRWRDDRFAAFHRECRFAGHPVNFEPGDEILG